MAIENRKLVKMRISPRIARPAEGIGFQPSTSGVTYVAAGKEASHGASLSRTKGNKCNYSGANIN